jgi:hypothetical protein
MPLSIIIGNVIGEELYDQGNIGSKAMISELGIELATENNDEIITES